MCKKIYTLFLILGSITVSRYAAAQCPTDPAKGFHVFVEKSAVFTSGKSEGSIAIGEDLTINGNYQVAVKSAGSFMIDNSFIALLVTGKVNYLGGNTFQINNGSVKIGNLENSKVWLTDDKGNYSNVQISNGLYNSSPRIQLLNKGKNLNTSDSKMEVEEKDLIDFGNAMETMRNSAASMGAKGNNVFLTDVNGNSVETNKFPAQVKITLQSGVNYLGINAKDFNSISELTYNNKPDANHVLVINIDAKDVFNWQVYKQIGVGIDDCPYILYNFYNTTTLNIEGINSIEGTVFAPSADIHKKLNKENIEGQIIGVSFEQEEGENHSSNFDSDAEEKGCKKPTVAAITGNNSVCVGLKTTLSSATSDGIWTSNATSVGIINNDGVVTGIAKGGFVISYAVTNHCGTTVVTSTLTATDCGNVNSGNTGGLESKSLGISIANRLYTAVTKSELVMKPYLQLPVLKQNLVSKQVTGITTQMNLLDLFPKQLSNPSITPYITTPTDIIGFTNAKAVASSDYTLNGICKAVVFATRTQSDMYDHTKAVCDRLKGATIQNVEKINLMGFDMLRYTMSYEDGHQENIISFSAGTKTGRNSFSIQSNWLKNDYVAEDELYNFQVWGVSNDILDEIARKLLEQLSTIAPLEQPYLVKSLPSIYIMGVNINKGSIEINMHHSNQDVNGRFEIFEIANEQSKLANKKNIPFSISSTGDSVIKIPATDIYESTLKMYVNDSLVDEVFISDGAWNVDYVPANTVVNKFEISNDSKRVVTDEYPVYRNIHLEASTNTYISAYKLLRGGGVAKDLTSYKTFRFTAVGNAVLNITLAKNSIKNWDDQYTLHIPISTNSKEYLIDLNDFVSAATKDKINPNDLNSIVFTMGSANGSLVNINTSLSNISFSKESVSYFESLKSKAIHVYPNPTSGKFFCEFNSEKNGEANLVVIDAYSGKLILSKTIILIKGGNKIPMDVSASYPTVSGGTCVVTIKNADITYESKKLIIKPN